MDNHSIPTLTIGPAAAARTEPHCTRSESERALLDADTFVAASALFGCVDYKAVIEATRYELRLSPESQVA
jgi:hypothetical protein